MRHYITKSKSGHYTLTIRSTNGSKIGCYRKLSGADSAQNIWTIFKKGDDKNDMGAKFEQF